MNAEEESTGLLMCLIDSGACRRLHRSLVAWCYAPAGIRRTPRGFGEMKVRWGEREYPQSRANCFLSNKTVTATVIMTGLGVGARKYCIECAATSRERINVALFEWHVSSEQWIEEKSHVVGKARRYPDWLQDLGNRKQLGCQPARLSLSSERSACKRTVNHEIFIWRCDDAMMRRRCVSRKCAMYRHGNFYMLVVGVKVLGRCGSATITGTVNH
ncbi:hypothetical protein B0J11DRAFT_520159 [Dendryphion nanum]|uniref:Uncharacterized protein n=1 Tax=Dendryphion nanum TaxID=256645 RepID=A0A9P9ITG9_9PLEO|nr:hypothetical protein B0J11DRAFT_520159 [Dendryphion nanum]